MSRKSKVQRPESEVIEMSEKDELEVLKPQGSQKSSKARQSGKNEESLSLQINNLQGQTESVALKM